jgi:dodecin
MPLRRDTSRILNTEAPRRTEHCIGIGRYRRRSLTIRDITEPKRMTKPGIPGVCEVASNRYALPSRSRSHTLLLGRPMISVVSYELFLEIPMAKDKETGVYRIVDVVGVSTVSWEDAAKRAVETAAKSIRDLRIAEVTKMDMKVEGGKVLAFRTRVALSFKYEG